ncbi:MAG: peptidoglycan editing factor PgeF [Pseudomonadales bacterium]|jgi:YfiH family protein|tara:strand:- start:4922 stop:5791 length:870 start_codon:yes stop_codon:yes gene_type:complete
MRAEPSWLPANWSLATDNNALGFTTTCFGGASGGAFAHNNMRFTIGDEPRAVTANRAKLLASISSHFNTNFADTHNRAEANSLAAHSRQAVSLQWLDQVHGNECVYVSADSLAGTPQADAAWTDEPGLGIAIQTADCVPILITDSKATIVGAAHAGWRGLVANIISNLVTSMPANPKDLVAWIGPCIGRKNFEVGEDVWSVILAILPDAVFKHPKDPAKRLVDLVAIARWQLQQCAVGSISSADICTYACVDFYSHRYACHQAFIESGSAIGTTGRMASVVVCAPKLTQ